MPLWAQLEAELRRRLANGEFVERFLTDREIVDTYLVSRHTAREAVDRLCAAGLLERRRGRGTYVHREYEQPTGALYSLFRSVEAQGAEQSAKVRALEVRTNADAAKRLGLKPQAPLVLLDRLRLADNEPLALDRVWLPATVARPLLDTDFERPVPLYVELARRCRLQVVSGWERIHPVIPTPEERETLRMPEREAIFAIERLGRTHERPVEWRVSLVRGDRYSFVTNWDPRSGVERVPTWQPSADAVSRNDHPPS